LERGRKRRKDARPAELVAAGLQEFALKGFAATRLEDVAKRAGVVKGTIYRYFSDKESLFKAAVQSRSLPVLDRIEGFIDAYPGTTRQLLHQVLRTIYADLVDSDLRILMRIMISEGQNFPEITEFYHREVMAKARAILDRIVARGIARGEVRPSAATDLAMVMMAPAVMATIWRMTFDRHDPIETQRFLAAHLALIDHGLLTAEMRGNAA
jgi:AcrR family transcriptional regulator